MTRSIPAMTIRRIGDAGQRDTAAGRLGGSRHYRRAQRELPRMLEEHSRIRAAVRGLRDVAESERALEHVQLADQLALHARTEEEALYPAALLVGDLSRARMMA